MILIIFFLAFEKFLKLNSQCLKGVTGNCLSCSWDTYNSNWWNSSAPIIETNCLSKNKSLSTIFYVSPNQCVSGSACDGSQVNPFDSIFKALTQAHNLSQTSLQPSIHIYLLQGTHYALQNQLPFTPFWYFRRTMASIIIDSLYCITLNISGCISNAAERVTVIVKTQLFSIFVVNELSIKNIDFNGFDSHISLIDSANACLNQKSICCTNANLLLNTSICFLQSFTLLARELTAPSVGIFTLESIIEMRYGSRPIINIINSSFSGFNARSSNSGFSALISSSSFGAIINGFNILSDSSYFQNGFLFNYDLSQESFYLNMDTNAVSNFQSSQLNTSVTALISNLLITQYNLFGINFSSPANLFTCCITPFSYFNLKGISLLNTNLINLKGDLLFQITNLNLLVDTLNIGNISNYHFGNFINSTIVFQNVNMSNVTLSQNTSTLFAFVLVKKSSFQINNSISKNIFIPFLKTFLIRDSNFSISYINSSTENFLSMIDSTNCTLTISNSQFSNFKGNKQFILSTNSLVNLLSSQFLDSTNPLSAFIWTESDQNFTFSQSLIKNISHFQFFIGTRTANLNLQGITLDNLTGTFFQSFDLATYNLYQTNVKITNSLFENVFANSNPIIIGPQYMWTLQNFYAENVTTNYYYLGITLFRNVIATDWFLKNITRKDVRGIFYFSSEKVPTMKLMINNFTVLNSGFLSIATSFNALSVYFFIRYFDYAETNNIKVVIPVDKFLENGVIEYVQAGTIVTNNISVTRPQFVSNFPAFGISFIANAFISNKNISLINLNCINPLLYYNSIQNSFGIITVVGSSAVNAPKLTQEFNISDLFISNCQCLVATGLGVLNINNFYGKNIVIENSQSYKLSGAINLMYIVQFVLSSVILRNCSGSYGSFYLETSFALLSEVQIINSSAFSQGVIYLSNGYISITNSKFLNSAAQVSGGVIYSTNTIVQIFNMTCSNSISALGGTIYLSSLSTLNLSLVTISNSSAQIGGFLYVDTANAVLISQASIENTKSLLKGNLIFLLEANVFQINGLNYVNSISNTTFGSLYIYSQEQIAFYFSNMNFTNIHCQVASFLYHSSNSPLVISNLILTNMSSSLFFVFSMNKQPFNFSNIIINKNNLVNYTTFDTFLFNFQRISVFLSNISINSSKTDTAFMASKTNLNISNLTFENNLYFLSGECLYFYLSESSFYSRIIFVNTTFPNIRIINSINSDIFCYITNLYNVSSNNPLFNFGESLALIDTTYIRDSFGKNGIFNSINSNTTISNLNCSSSLAEKYFFSDFDGFPGIFLKFDSNDMLEHFSLMISSINLYTNFHNSFIAQISRCDNLTISNSIFVAPFQNFSLQNSTKGFLLVNNDKILIINSGFYNFSGINGGTFQISNLDNSSDIFFSNSSIQRSWGVLGGAIFTKGIINLTVDSLNFVDNFVSYQYQTFAFGGSIYIDCLYLNQNCQNIVKNSNFSNCTSQNFANIIFSKASINATTNNINPTKSINPQIVDYPANYLLSTEFNVKEQINNYTYVYSCINNAKNRQNQNKSLNMTAVSGVLMNFSVILVDSNYNLLNFDNYTSSGLDIDISSIPSNTNSQLEGGTTLAVKGVLFFENVKVTIKPNSNLKFILKIFFNLPQSSSNQIPQIIPISDLINVYVRNCIPGEILLSDNSCYMCKPGSYSIIDPMVYDGLQECTYCPSNAICPGGNQIYPIDGYWRSSPKSILIKKCLNLDACVTSISSNNSYVSSCGQYYEGYFCQKCIEGYARLIKTSSCVKCSDNIFSYFVLLIALVAICLYVLIQVKYYIKLNKNDDTFIGVMLKIFVNHFQQLNLVTVVGLGWTNTLKSFFSFFYYFSFLSEDMFSTDCFFTQINYNVFFFKVLFSCFLPLIITILTMGFWKFRMIIKIMLNRNEMKNQIMAEIKVTFAISIYMMFPQIMKVCFEVLNCDKIDEISGIQILTASPDKICFDLAHMLWISLLSIPGILIWGILPLSFFLFTMKKEKRFLMDVLRETELIQTLKKINSKGKISSSKKIEFKSQMSVQGENPSNFTKKVIFDENVVPNTVDSSLDGSSNFANTSVVRPKIPTILFLDETHVVRYIIFIYRGYKPKYYYWEIIIFLKKFIFILLGSFNSLVGVEVKAMLLIITFVIYCTWIQNTLPYNDPRFNRIEIISGYNLFITSNIGILMLSSNISFISIFGGIIILMLQVYFVIYWIFVFITQIFSHKIKRLKTSVIRRLSSPLKRNKTRIRASC